MKNFTDALIEEYQKLNITDIILFDNIERIDITSDKDLDGMYEELSEDFKVEKYEMPKESVQAVINGFKECTEIHANDYYKTNKFLKANDLTLDDCLEIIHGLKVSDYYKNVRSINNDYAGNNLIIFEPEVIKLSSGKEFKDLTIYLKLDLDATTNEAVALFSVHQGERNKLPYNEV